MLPGEEIPETRDLLTEGSLPIEERALQRRYTQLERFNVFLPPTGKYTLPGPDRVPSTTEGMYLLLLRVEATDDKDTDSDLAAVDAGAGTVHSGAVAGFPLPVLRYFVGGSQSTAAQPQKKLALLQPADEALLSPGKPVDFSWSEDGQAAFYRLEVEVFGKATTVEPKFLPS